MAMIKFMLFAILGLLVTPTIFASYAIGQDADCVAIMSQLKEAQSQSKDYRHEAKKAFENWDKYYKELHSYTYEATDQPLAVSAKKCEAGEGLGKAFCKGALDKYNEISAKEGPAKAELMSARAKASEARQNYNLLVKQADMEGCNKKE
ncbi:MAG: hypothetical protein V3T32_02075 [Thermodesulfobacteriota bacterium]|jgi:hypothetical protein